MLVNTVLSLITRTLDIVSCTLGSGNRGRDPWKLYRPGLFHVANTLTKSAHNRVYKYRGLINNAYVYNFRAVLYNNIEP